MRRLLLLCMVVGVLSVYPALCVLAQTGKAEQTQISPERMARIRLLIATLGPDYGRGSCMPGISPAVEARDELVAIGKPATLLLCAVLKEKNAWRRIMAAEALAEIRDRRALKPLLYALQRDTSDTV